MSESITMLTTTDNPFCPFEEFEDWFKWDENAGYHTCSYLARVAKTSNELSEADEDIIIQNAIDEIVRMNLTGTYKKVVRGEGSRDTTPHPLSPSP